MGNFYTTLFDLAVNTISELGYFGIYLGMIVDSTGFPIPSQVIMGFAGYMVYTGEFNLWLAALAGSLGNVTGGVVIFFLAKRYGRSFVKRFGKYIKYTEEDLHAADGWFERWGDELVFFAQLIPGLRTVMAVPSGVWKVKFTKFLPYLFAGTYTYSFIITFLGYKFGSNWEDIGYYIETFENVTYLVLAVVITYLVVKYIRKKKA